MILKYGKRIALAVVTFTIIFIMYNYASAEDLQRQKNVLLLHSYNEGTGWTNNQNKGIIETLQRSYDNCSIDVKYMDWKNYPTEENLKILYNYYRAKYLTKKFDLIITTDDAALSFALKYRQRLFSNAPIVFSGVNQVSLAKIRGNYKNFTGVIEEADPTQTINIALKINPAIQNVYVVYDNSESGISTGRIVNSKIKAMKKKLNIIDLNNLSFKELLETVSKLGDKDMLLFSTYYRDVNGKVVEFDLASKEISKNSSIPMYHQFTFGLNKGAFGGNMISGELSGKYTAELALRILNGESADSIPISSPNIAKKVFDYEQLKRFGISAGKLPDDAEIINKPFDFFETYQTLVLVVLFVFAVLFSFVLTLIIYISKINKVKTELYNSHEELTLTYEELVATDEELKNQLREIETIQGDLSKSEEKYTYLALHDVLTGLPNRRSLFDDAKKIFSNSLEKAALLFIDMDNFKYINDTMGHEFGDELIKQVSERISLDLDSKSTLYRLGGDEFILLRLGTKDKLEVEKVISDILYSFSEEFCVKNSALHITFSIGVALFPDHGRDIEELIKSADIAMYKAKENGKNKFIIYEKSMDEAFNERMNLEKHLHTAMDKDEFELYYQPQLDLKNNKISGLEALLRWKNPELGFVSPVKFIRVAEDTHLIIALGEWVLIQACDFISQLHKNGYKDLTISVNISTIQIFQADFTEKVLRILEYFRLNPRYLELEVTETVLIESFDLVNKKLEKLSEKGISIALDDFGKGYSSLSYLKQLPISTLKIDKCFIDNLSLMTEDKTITRHIITLGKSLGMSIVAEGVETNEQMEYLKKYKCDKIQGYLFSKPLPKNEAEKLIEINQSENKQADISRN
jgi:diguanylate cyclase (GGDEF)-like protein